MKKLLIFLFIPIYCYADIGDMEKPIENKQSKSKILDGLMKTENGQSLQKKADKIAKDNNLEYLAPLALVQGKIRFKVDQYTISMEKDKAAITYTWRFP
jgi:hypothetical protein